MYFPGKKVFGRPVVSQVKAVMGEAQKTIFLIVDDTFSHVCAREGNQHHAAHAEDVMDGVFSFENCNGKAALSCYFSRSEPRRAGTDNNRSYLVLMVISYQKVNG